jgi:excisionase family DNA binding protein
VTTRTRYLSLNQAARELGVHPRTLAAWIADGRFPAFRTPGGHYRIAETDLALALEPVRSGGGEREERQP